MTEKHDGDKLIQADYATTSWDDVPAEELIRMTREFIRRITNQDRQRLARDLRVSGHHRALVHGAPPTLQRFFAGETDLDSELAQRFVHAPLLSHARYSPAPGEPVNRQASAYFTSQDDSALLTVDAPVGNGIEAAVEFTFTVMSMVGLRFHVEPLSVPYRRAWLELIRRENGITFLWTMRRWEQPYLIFVIRDYFAWLYAFSPAGLEAGARLTPDTVAALADWLEAVWFPSSARGVTAVGTEDAPLSERPTLLEPPTGLPRHGEPKAPPEFGESAEGDEPPPGEQSPDTLSPDDLTW